MNDSDFLKGKRVLLTTSHTDVGSGGSMQMFLLARGLSEAGAKVDALFKKSRQGRVPKLDQYLSINARIDFFRPNRWYFPTEIMRLRTRLLQQKYDIIHTHKGGDLSLVMLASKGIQIPVMVNQRGVNFPLGLNRFKYNWRRLHRIIVVSEESKRVMINCGVRPEKIEVIYGGVDTERFSPGEDGSTIRAELGIPDDAPVFIVVANLVKQKGHGDYLKAAAILDDTHPGCYHIFAGSGEQSGLRRVVEDSGLSGKVIFTGFRTDIPALFAASDISVFPGFAGEGVSGVLRESLACRVPVITTDVGGNAEIIRHEKYGLVTPVRNPEKLAAAMARFLDDKTLASQLGENGRRFVIENHSAQARNARIFALYEKIASGIQS